jgi:glucose dehydrogenase
MPKSVPIALPSEGGSYVVDPKTGQPVLVERTAPAEALTPATDPTTPAPAAADVTQPSAA